MVDEPLLPSPPPADGDGEDLLGIEKFDPYTGERIQTNLMGKADVPTVSQDLPAKAQQRRFCLYYTPDGEASFFLGFRVTSCGFILVTGFTVVVLLGAVAGYLAGFTSDLSLNINDDDLPSGSDDDPYLPTPPPSPSSSLSGVTYEFTNFQDDPDCEASGTLDELYGSTTVEACLSSDQSSYTLTCAYIVSYDGSSYLQASVEHFGGTQMSSGYQVQSGCSGSTFDDDQGVDHDFNCCWPSGPSAGPQVEWSQDWSGIGGNCEAGDDTLSIAPGAGSSGLGVQVATCDNGTGDTFTLYCGVTTSSGTGTRTGTRTGTGTGTATGTGTDKATGTGTGTGRGWDDDGTSLTLQAHYNDGQLNGPAVTSGCSVVVDQGSECPYCGQCCFA